MRSVGFWLHRTQGKSAFRQGVQHGQLLFDGRGRGRVAGTRVCVAGFWRGVAGKELFLKGLPRFLKHRIRGGEKLHWPT